MMVSTVPSVVLNTGYKNVNFQRHCGPVVSEIIFTAV
jgi:hypothetical protein